MKLLFVLNGLKTGGTEVVIKNLTLHLQTEYVISIIALDQVGVIADEISANSKIKIYCLNRKPGWHLVNFINFFSINNFVFSDFQYRKNGNSKRPKCLQSNPLPCFFGSKKRQF